MTIAEFCRGGFSSNTQINPPDSIDLKEDKQINEEINQTEDYFVPTEKAGEEILGAVQDHINVIRESLEELEADIHNPPKIYTQGNLLDAQLTVATNILEDLTEVINNLTNGQ